MTLGLAKIVVTYGAPRKQKRCLLQFMLFAAAVVALSLAGATPAFAQCTDSWTGNAGDNLWSDGGNWSTGSQPGGSDSACIQTAGASVSMDVSDAVANLTVGTGDTLQISNGGTYSNLRLDGSSIVNNGSIVLPGSTVFGSSLSIGSGNTVTLSGTGAINLVISTVTIAGYGNPSTLINQSTIQGTGFVGYAGVSINNTASGVINANSSGNPLTIGRNGNNTNTGVFKATNGGQFVFGSAALNNVGGTIEAIGANSSASFTAQGQGGQTITGGTFTTSGGGVIYSNQSTLIDGTGGNTVTNNGTMIIPPSGNHPGSSFQGTIKNTGSIQILGNASQSPTVSIPSGQTWTLTGSGHFVMGDGTSNSYNNTTNINGGGTFVNEQLLEGTGNIENLTTFSNSGTVNANVPTGVNNLMLVIASDNASANTGLMEASNGGALDIQNTALTNTGGTIEAAGTGSYVVLDTGLTLKGGTVTSSGGGIIYGQRGVLLDGTTSAITNSSTFEVGNTSISAQGTLDNTGTIKLIPNASGGPLLAVPSGETFTLKGSGKLVMGDGTNNGYNNYTNIGSNLVTSATFVNQSTIDGTGTMSQIATIVNNGTINDNVAVGVNGLELQIGWNVSTFTNNGTLEANNGGEVTFPGALGTFTNKGTLNAGANSTVNIAGGENFTNLSAGTLTGGSYKATGTLQIPGNVTTNAANIMLTGLTSQILNPNTNALTGLLTNTSKGSLTLAGGQNFTTAGTFTNQGAISIGKNSTFTVAASGSYVQTGGKTTVSGELTVAGTTTGAININKGFVYGNGGTIAGDLSSSGTVNPGLSIASAGKLTATNYTQSSVGALNANIGGANAGQFGVLNVTGTANLGGVLNIKLLGTFVPLIGATFEILTAGSVHGTFATVNGTAINSSEHFTVTYNSNNVTLTVVSGA